MQNAAQLGKLHEVDIHASFEPKKTEQGVIVDAHGEPVTRTNGMMVRLDEKAKQAVTISRGTLWFIGTVIAVVPVLILIVVYVITVAMGYQGTLSQVKEIDGRVTKLENGFVELQTLKLNVNDIKSDVVQIKKTQENNEQDRKDVLKNISDIRILLAQRQMEKP